MPTYEYQCGACGHRFEEFQSITAAPIKKCPQCGKNKVQRLIGCGAALIFKGSGFYQTDYRSDSYKAGQKADKETTGSTKSDTKSDTKSESKDNSKTKSKDKQDSA